MGPLCMGVPFHAWVSLAPWGSSHWMYQSRIGRPETLLIVAAPR